jgi:hypothetical protein
MYPLNSSPWLWHFTVKEVSHPDPAIMNNKDGALLQRTKRKSQRSCHQTIEGELERLDTALRSRSNNLPSSERVATHTKWHPKTPQRLDTLQSQERAGNTMVKLATSMSSQDGSSTCSHRSRRSAIHYQRICATTTRGFALAINWICSGTTLILVRVRAYYIPWMTANSS